MKLMNFFSLFICIILYSSIIACSDNKPSHIPSYLQDTLKNGNSGPKLAIIPTGTGVVGGENFRSFKNQSPQHKVISTQEFAMGIAEVTFKEYDAFCRSTFIDCPDDNGWGRGSQPVNNVSWLDAIAYTEWLSEQANQTYRLPSEAEWEYAARAGTSNRYYFGDDTEQTLVCDYENTADLTGENILQRDASTSYVNFFNGKSNCVDHAAYASIVGMYKPNPFGLHDMISNVVEFIADCYKDNYKDAHRDGKPWENNECEYRVARGGSWHWNTFPVSRRGVMGEDFVGGVEGFRLALDGAAPSLSNSTKKFYKDLKVAQRSEQLKRDAILPYPDTVKNLTLDQTAEMVLSLIHI